MLRNPNFQKLINLGVIVVLLAIPLMGALLFLPQRSPLGPLLGQLTKLNVTKSYMQSIMSGLMSSMDPKEVAVALEENPDTLVDLMGYMDLAGMAGAINDNADWVAELLGYIDASVIAEAVNENPEFLEEMMGSMDPEAIAKMFNMNIAKFAVNLVNELDPKVLAEAINQNGEFLGAVLSSMDPAAIAVMGADMLSKIQLGSFPAELLGALDAQVLANAINNNGPWIGSLIGKVDPSMLSSAMTPEVVAFAGDLIPLINPELITGILNENQAWISRLVGYIDVDELSSMMGKMMPQMGGFIKRTMAAINPSFVGALVNDAAFLTRMMSKINPSVLGVHMGTIMDFGSNVLAYVDPAAVAGILNNSGPFVSGLLNALSADFFGAMLNNAALMNNVMGAINFGPIANAINNNGGLITSLLVKVGSVDMTPILGMVDTLVSGMTENMGFIQALIGELDMDKLMGMIANMKPWISQLMGELDPGVIANIINNNGAWIASILPQMDPAMLSPIMANMDTSFISGLMQKLDIATLGTILNDIGPFVSDLMGKMDMAVLGTAINDNIPILGNIIQYLDPQKLAAVMNNSGSMVGELMQYLDGEVIASVINNNGPFLEKVILNLDLGVILDAINTDVGEEFLARVMASMTDMTMDMGPILEVLGDVPDFITGLLDPVDGVDLNIIIPILDQAGPLVSGVLQYMDMGALTGAIADAITPSYIQGGPDGILYDILKPVAQGGIDPAMLANVINNLNMGPLVGELLGNLDISAFMPLLERQSVKDFLDNMITTMSSRPEGLLNILNGVNTPAATSNLHTILVAVMNDDALMTYVMDQVSLPHQTLDSTLDWFVAQVYLYGLSGLLSDPYAYGMIGNMSVI